MFAESNELADRGITLGIRFRFPTRAGRNGWARLSTIVLRSLGADTHGGPPITGNRLTYFIGQASAYQQPHPIPFEFVNCRPVRSRMMNAAMSVKHNTHTRSWDWM